MSLFNLRLSPELHAKLKAEADLRGVSRSDIARDAITAYLAGDQTEPREKADMQDDWSEFGSQVIDAQRTILTNLINKLDKAEWEEVVEPIYATFREMTIAKSRSYQNPWLNSRNQSPPFDPQVVAAIGFASDDVHEIKVSLEQVFFEYAWNTGEEAFAEIPAIWQRAKQRLDAGERQAS